MKLNGRKVFNFFNIVFMVFLIVVTAYPMYYVIIASFSDPTELARHSGFLWLPLKPYTSEAYEVLLDHPLILSGFRNSIIVVVLGTFLNIIFTALGAYFLAVDGPMFKNVVAIMVIITMYFSGGLIPKYLLVKDLGLYNTLWSLMLPGLISTTNLIIMKTAFKSIPPALIEAALLDGASYFKILFKIMIPLSKATIAVLVLYYAVGHWNSWFNASIYLRDSDLYPVQLATRNLLEKPENLEGAGEVVSRYSELMQYALIVVVSTPMLLLYPFIQKYFTKGVMIGSVKG